METKEQNQNKVDSFLNELRVNKTVIDVAKYFDKDIETVCKLVEKFVVILYYRNGAIKEIKIDFKEMQSALTIKQRTIFLR